VPALEAALSEKAQEAEQLRQNWQAAEADRAARLEVIHRLGGAADRVPALEAALSEKAQEAEQLRQNRQAAEADRAARLEAIQRLFEALRQSDADRAAQRDALARLEGALRESEADRAARLVVIQQLVSSRDQPSILARMVNRLKGGRLCERARPHHARKPGPEALPMATKS
jgi:hypothetical protein